MKPVTWLAAYDVAGEPAFRIGRAGDELVAEWVGLARLVARRDGTASRLEPLCTGRRRELDKIARGGARLLLRQLGGKLAFHGAAVGWGGRAVVLLGRSGQGKSTLAASLCVRRAAELFADDAVAVDLVDDGGHRRLQVTPGEAEHWLDPAARHALGLGENEASAKAPARALCVAGAPAHVTALVDLAFEDVREQTLERLNGVDALAALVPQAVRFVLDEPAVQQKELDVLAEIVEHVPMFRLVRPRRLELLESAAALVDAIAREPQSRR